MHGIETRSIDGISLAERHGKVSDQGPFWFAGNFQFLSISLGFIGPSMGLSLLWTSIAGIFGIVFGTLFMALHATQGPVLGLPQMVQSRAQFGFRGVVIPLFGTFINCGGFNMICALSAMEGLRNLFGWNQYFVLTMMTIPSVFISLYGYDWIHLFFKIVFWISLPLMGVLSVWLAVSGVSAGVPPKLGFNSLAFGVQFATCASYNIGFAPYVSDYSRYLPRNTRPASIIASVFWGAAGSAAWLVVLGAVLASRFNAIDPLVALKTSGDTLFHGFGWVLAIDSIIVLIGILALDNYSGMLTLMTAADSFRSMPRTKLMRTILILLFTAIWLVATLICGQSSKATLGLVLIIVLYLLLPWTAVNLVDFFLIRRGRYSVAELSKPNGIYKNWAWPGLLAYALGWAAIVPFAVLPGVWTGPLADKIGGVDISWLSGLVVSGISYFVIAKVRGIDLEGAGMADPEPTAD